ncbi:hypothetical protein [Anaeromyxobacter dehalogenans]|uniref:hypothetical protein n=1 Tax=Anaeromyxobacter dehalogenans TaxID=161493 RepID=UPI000164D772|nr:hypothetical protein [Anaeromyxobacter dehalogenans]
MTWAGPAALGLFVGGVIASLRGWIPQRVVTLQALLLAVAGLAIGFSALAGRPIPWPQLLASANVHPVPASSPASCSPARCTPRARSTPRRACSGG